MNGRYGPYIAYKGSNYKIPKDIVPEDLSLDACLEIVKLQSEKAASAPAKPKRGNMPRRKHKAIHHKTSARNERIIPGLMFYNIICNYILSGTSIPNNPMPRRTTLATFSDKARRNTFTASSSSRRILKSW